MWTKPSWMCYTLKMSDWAKSWNEQNQSPGAIEWSIEKRDSRDLKDIVEIEMSIRAINVSFQAVRWLYIPWLEAHIFIWFLVYSYLWILEALSRVKTNLVGFEPCGPSPCGGATVRLWSALKSEDENRDKSEWAQLGNACLRERKIFSALGTIAYSIENRDA